jgi:eukaryotic-like serine/threonine-protein kinase
MGEDPPGSTWTFPPDDGAPGTPRDPPPGGWAPGAAPDDDLPRQIGRFTILGRLGCGGMGEVFLAFDPRLSRKVALKRIRENRAEDPSLRRRFEIEAKVTSILQHPSIVPVYQYDDEGADLYYTMRPIEGISLSELIEDLAAGKADPGADWSAARLVRLFLQATSAIAYAHSRGVIHRDLKPSNIMIGPFEEVLVLDWGMAKVIEEGKSENGRPPLDPLLPIGGNTGGGPGYLIGTPAYMSPEGLRNEPATFGNDIFALGLILYELLALRHPWLAPTLPELSDAMTRPPEPPARLQPARNIPEELSEVALRSIAYDPAARFPTVADFAKAVAQALEGSAPWSLEASGEDHDRWKLMGGHLKLAGDELLIGSRGAGGTFRYFCMDRFPDDARLEFEFAATRGDDEIWAWFNHPQPRDTSSEIGYRLGVFAGRRKSVALLRSGRIVAGVRSSPEPRAWHRVTAMREDDRLSLRLDGEELYAYRDPIPLTGGFLGLAGRGATLRIRNIHIASRGTSATVSCLAVPDAFYNRRFFEVARDEYRRIAASLPGRAEGKMAAFRAGLCILEMARQEEAPDMRAWLLGEARAAFSNLPTNRDSRLAALGRAMVAAEEEAWPAVQDALLDALVKFRGEAHIDTVEEWILGRLHVLGEGQRQIIAAFLPLGLLHCRNERGRRLIGDLVREVQRTWEFPSFMISRGRFREGDPISCAESRLLLSFWSGSAQHVAESFRDILAAGARPHHVSDACFALLELGRTDLARMAIEEAIRTPAAWGGEDGGAVSDLCRSSVLAAEGDLEAADALFGSAPRTPDDRTYNAARLRLSRAHFDAGRIRPSLKVLQPLGPSDNFALEHRAWLFSFLGEGRRATKNLGPLLARGDHRTGRNLANFLQGISLILAGRPEEALRTFSQLSPEPWPRTWTLGSHYALGRLGEGDLDRYLRGAFPWERSHLRSQALLLARARGEPPESLHPGLAPAAS